MKITSLITLVLVTGVYLLGYSSPSYSANYYKCSSGYKFQTNGNDSARCFKAAKMTYKSPNKCLSIRVPIINKSIGHYLRKDHEGKSDKCVGTFKVAGITNHNVVDLVCPHGYGLEVKNGTDRCKKAVPAASKAPSVRVNR